MRGLAVRSFAAGAAVLMFAGAVTTRETSAVAKVSPRSAFTIPVSIQIVAHQDDDFLFMNPDAQDALNFGFASVTVYMTAGESVGTSCAQQPCPDDRAAYRQHGIRAAYAHMDGLGPDGSGGYESYWNTTLWQPDGVHYVERSVLISDPRVVLIFMNLPDQPDENLGSPTGYSMYRLYSDPTFVTGQVTATGSRLLSLPMSALQMDQAAVYAVLKKVLANYQPVFIRALDPQPFQILSPDPSYQAPGCPAAGYIVCFDNSDHTFAGRFADVAFSHYNGPNGTKRASIDHYVGYSFLDYPQNLGDADYDAKSATGQTYAPYDPTFVGYDPYYHVMKERYPGGTQWLARFANGRLAAFTVEHGQVYMFREVTAGGGAWTGPTVIGTGGPYAPDVTVVQRHDGRLQLFALRLPLADTVPQSVVTSVQNAGTMTFSSWTSLGNPQVRSGQCQDAMSGCRWMGVPTAAVDGNGAIFAFVKGSDGLVYYKHSTSSSWSKWTYMPSTLSYGDARLDVQDGIAAAPRPDGRIEVFAAERGGGMQHDLEGPLISPATFSTEYDFPSGSPITDAASAPTITKNADGRLEIFYREAYSGRVITYYTNTSGTWVGPVILYGDSGVGPVAAIMRSSGEIELFERNVWHGISATWQVAPNSSFQLQWTILGGYLEEYPAAAPDVNGETALVVKGGDGRLYLSREAAGTGSFGSYSVIG
jgi:hypothetical protein